jgi:hypothetical protein
MTLFYSHHDRLHASAGTHHHPIMHTLKRVRSALRTLHRAIAERPQFVLTETGIGYRLRAAE